MDDKLGVDVCKVTSSAKRGSPHSSSGEGKSAIRMFHSIGLRTLPCGTPLEILLSKERVLLILTLTALLVRKL